MNTLFSKPKTFVLFSLFCCLSFSQLIGQTDETPDAFYKWKKDKTDFQQGYVVLISGKRMDGQISLILKNGSIKEIKFNGDGKELKLPAESVSAYGLSSKPVVNDSPEDLYKWRTGAEVMGKMVTQTKPRQGYVILSMTGQRVSGDLQLKKVDDRLELIKVGSEKYSPDQVSNYGLEITIAELTKDGSKTYKHEGRNFHPGTLTLASGEVKSGILAFRESTLINDMKPAAGAKYSYVYYAENQNGFVNGYNSEIAIAVTQTINGKEIRYQYFDGHFIPMGALENLTFKDKTREFQVGTITFPNGEQRSGKIAQVKYFGTFYTHAINFMDDSGMVTSYLGDEVDSFTQTLEGKETDFFGVSGVFVEKMFDGKVFQLYRNPFPSTENKFLKGLTQGAATAGTSIASYAISKNEAEKKGYLGAGLHDKIAEASPEELDQMEGEIQAYLSSLGNDELSKEVKKTLNKQLVAVHTASLSREIASSGGPGIKKKEWVIYNVQSNTEVIIVESKYKKQVEHLLMGCYTYLGLEKSQQKTYTKFGNLTQAVTMLDECF